MTIKDLLCAVLYFCVGATAAAWRGYNDYKFWQLEGSPSNRSVSLFLGESSVALLLFWPVAWPVALVGVWARELAARGRIAGERREDEARQAASALAEVDRIIERSRRL